MEQIRKQARMLKAALDESELALINAQALRTLDAEDVFVFRLAACNNQVDRDIERFTEGTLEGLAGLFVGRPVLMDHKWSAGSQTARVYAAGVEDMPGVDGGRQHGVLPPGGGYNGHALLGSRRQRGIQPRGKGLMVIQKGSPVQVHGKQGNLHMGTSFSKNAGHRPGTAYHFFQSAATARGINQAAGPSGSAA